MVELLILIIIGIWDLFKLFLKIVFKILYFIFWSVVILVAAIFGNTKKISKVAKPNYSNKKKHQKIDWDDTDEYVMYDELLYDEDE